jgi:hypothetical protein
VREHGGLGLGLAIARHLVEGHDGTIEAQSEGEGRGATFRVRLPLQHRAAPAPRRPAGSATLRSATGARDGKLRGATVLLVEDHAERAMPSSICCACSARVLCASSAPRLTWCAARARLSSSDLGPHESGSR